MDKSPGTPEMSKLNLICLLIIISTLSIIKNCEAINKYSAAANKPVKNVKKASSSLSSESFKDSNEIPVPTSLREIEKPYRMAKLNLVWTKAKHVSNQDSKRSLIFIFFINQYFDLFYLTEID